MWKKDFLSQINWPAFLVLGIYPPILFGVLGWYIVNFGISWFAIGSLIIGYYTSNISVGIGLHRLWAHNAYKASKAVEFILVFLTAGTLQGPALVWASDHFKHHAYTDQSQDPHSPLRFKNKFKGFFWSHMGWMLVKSSIHAIDRVTMKKLGKNKLLLWQLKHYWKLAVLMNTLFPFLIGYAVGGDWWHGFIAFLFAGVGRAIQQHMTFCVNSVCHFIGAKSYANSTAGDIWWLAPLLLGENWHNFHHAFPSDYRNGAKWYQFDVHKWIIYLMSKVNLASDLQFTPEFRIKAKTNEAFKSLLNSTMQEWELLKQQVDGLVEGASAKLSKIEQSSLKIKQHLQTQLKEMHYYLLKISHEATNMSYKSSSRQLLNKISKQVAEFKFQLMKLKNDLIQQDKVLKV